MWLGITIAILTGILWIIVGIVFKYAGNRASMTDIMLVESILKLPVFMCFMAGMNEFGTAHQVAMFAVGAAGFINMIGMLLMQKAMADGNGGVAWAIGQSALVASFITGILFFGEEFSWIRSTGTVLIIGGMIILGLAQRPEGDESKKTSRRSYRWLAYAFLAFFMLCIAQSTIASASNWSLSTGLRGVMMTSGGLIFCMVGKVKTNSLRIDFNRVFIISLVMLCTLGVMSELTSFVALDYLADVGLSGIGYPIMLGVCIAGFAVYSVFFLHEEAGRLTWSGIILIVIGIFAMPNYAIANQKADESAIAETPAKVVTNTPDNEVQDFAAEVKQ